MPLSPKISVVLPTHNRNEVLPRAIRSVLAQTLPPYEIIIVDDASNQDVSTVVQAFNDPRLKLLRRDQCGGAGSARNMGAAHASGDWIAFQDSDDAWLIQRLEKQWSQISEDVDLVCCSYLTLPCERQPWVTNPSTAMLAGDWNLAEQFDFPFITPTWLMRRRRFLELGGFDESLPNLEDWEMVFRLEGRIRVINDVEVVKYGSWDALNTARTRRLASVEYIFKKHASLWESDRKTKMRMLVEIARLQQLTGDASGSRSSAHKAIATHASYPAIKACGKAWAGQVGRRLQLRLRSFRTGSKR